MALPAIMPEPAGVPATGRVATTWVPRSGNYGPIPTDGMTHSNHDTSRIPTPNRTCRNNHDRNKQQHPPNKYCTPSPTPTPSTGHPTASPAGPPKPTIPSTPSAPPPTSPTANASASSTWAKPRGARWAALWAFICIAAGTAAPLRRWGPWILREKRTKKNAMTTTTAMKPRRCRRNPIERGKKECAGNCDSPLGCKEGTMPPAFWRNTPPTSSTPTSTIVPIPSLRRTRNVAKTTDERPPTTTSSSCGIPSVVSSRLTPTIVPRIGRASRTA
mmetsp:Transcript_24872/g.49573  ORF Transcript_24872/g.49573 Transcript_24872/m.49573 type:complete len:273 (+) Transcript_24872:251-1069(+)